METKAKPAPLLRREQAVEYLRDKHGLPITKAALAKAACYGGGPAFRKFGRHPLYAPADLDAYAAEAVSAPVRSTAELPTAQRRRSA